jgi:hypothetical protein
MAVLLLLAGEDTGDVVAAAEVLAAGVAAGVAGCLFLFRSNITIAT